MLTKELIKGSQVLSGLNDDQIAAIETLSRNDENAVIAQKIGEIHGRYDEDFKTVFGVDKPHGVKSYDFWKEKAKEIKAIADKAGDTTEIDQLKTTISDLEKQIKDGKGDQALVAKLEKEKADYEKTIADLRQKYSTEENEWKTKYEAKEKEVRESEVQRLFDTSIEGIKFKDGIPESTQRALIAAAKKELLSSHDVEIETDQLGNKKLIFKKDGAILSNKANGLNPYTPKELITEHAAIKEVLFVGNKQTGTGTKPGAPGKLVGEIIDVGTPKNKVEAMEAIKKGLAAQGISITDPRHKQIMDKTWNEVVTPMNLDAQ